MCSCIALPFTMLQFQSTSVHSDIYKAWIFCGNQTNIPSKGMDLYKSVSLKYSNVLYSYQQKTSVSTVKNVN